MWQRLLLLLFTIHSPLFTFSQVGTWQNYLAYHDIKNRISHRARATQKLADYLLKK